jgi:NADPH-dependent glutamate synthase beta subunit-like oxidoreductase/formate hydrogenlyase subunit 6/NADH:ubiquinone oxidoreductase subunit I
MECRLNTSSEKRDTMATKQKVLEFANKVSRKKMGSQSGIQPTDPEYRILEPVVTEEMAEVALCLEMRRPQSAAEVAAVCGKVVDETSRLLWELAMAGVCFVNTIDGVDKYWHDTWVPGIMEMMTNNKENVKKYPQIAEAFEAYGRVRGPATAGNFPVGIGLMRVIPIESAIDGNSRKASYEEVSNYLNENTIFSVSDCSCRTVREVMGEGCGHLKEDMCIQMGHAAEYYIRTGRGRAISREEAFGIIRRAEENGLVHQIPNTDGPGKTHAICNCCGCSCLSLRTAEMFINTDMVRSNYVSHIDREKCVACGACVEACPVNALQLSQKLCGPTSAFRPERETPRDNDWGPEKWNSEYRYNRTDVVDGGTSPCKTSCPAHIGIQGYIKLAAQGKYREALELIKQANPFPAVCGRICPRNCESECTRSDLDAPLAIDEVKKFIADQDLNTQHRYVPKIKQAYRQKIAIVGAGPAGLSCAYYLAIEGYPVTVFEKQPVPGGMLTLGIPAFRLEKNVVRAEIDILTELGVAFQFGVEVGNAVSLDDLRKQGYEAFYLAIGAQASRKLNIEGETAPRVLAGVDFLRRLNLGENLELHGNVIVIGGGNVAIDVARSAVRVGAAKVEMYCLESRAQMPALSEEVEEALSEEIAIHNAWGPKRIVTKDGLLAGVEFTKCVSVFDKNGRFSPVYDETVTKFVEADFVLVSIGQAIDWGTLLVNSQAELNPNGTIKADPLTYQTGQADVFAGGDIYTGPKFAIDAIAAGKQAAISMHRFVHPGQSLTIGRSLRHYPAFDKTTVNLEGYDHLPRQEAGHSVGASAKSAFKDPRTTFTEAQVKQETARCLSCGATVVDAALCVGCGVCTTKCKFDAVSLVREYNGVGAALPDMKPIVIRQMLKRKVRIAGKKATRYIRSIIKN